MWVVRNLVKDLGKIIFCTRVEHDIVTNLKRIGNWIYAGRVKLVAIPNSNLAWTRIGLGL